MDSFYSRSSYEPLLRGTSSYLCTNQTMIDRASVDKSMPEWIRIPIWAALRVQHGGFGLPLTSSGASGHS